ncbi:ATP-binding protein [Thermoproteota archaeon]
MGSNPFMYGLVFRPFFESCGWSEVHRMGDILMENRKGLSTIPRFRIDLNGLDDPTLDRTVRSAYTLLRHSKCQIPAETGLRIIDSLTELIADNLDTEMSKKDIIRNVGKEGVLRTADRQFVARAMLNATAQNGQNGDPRDLISRVGEKVKPKFIEAYLNAKTVFGSIPNQLDNLSKLFYSFKQFESEFTNFVLVDTYFNRLGEAVITYSFVPGSEHLLNYIQYCFNEGNIKAVPQLIEGGATVRVSPLNHDQQKNDIFGEDVKYLIKPSVKSILEERGITYSAKDNSLIINGIDCGSIDGNGIVDFSTNIRLLQGSVALDEHLITDSFYDIHIGSRYSLENPMESFGFKVNYVPKGRKKPVYLLPAYVGAATGITTGIVLAASGADAKTSLLGGAVSGAVAFAGGIKINVSNEDDLIRIVEDALQQINKADIEQETALEAMMISFDLIQQSIAKYIKKAEESKVQKKALEDAQILYNQIVLAAATVHDINNALGLLNYYKDYKPDEIPEDLLQPIQTITDLNKALEDALQHRRKREVIYVPQFLENDVTSITKIYHKYFQSNIHSSENAALAKVEVAPVMLKQLTQNMLLNSKDADARNIDVNIDYVILSKDDCYALNNHPNSAGADLKQGAYAKANYKDDGTGILPDVISRIFEFRYSTKVSEGDEEQQARGIGLAGVVAGLYEEKGRILVESTPGKGAEFTAYIPATKKATKVR